jgi:hypothetical protein
LKVVEFNRDFIEHQFFIRLEMGTRKYAANGVCWALNTGQLDILFRLSAAVERENHLSGRTIEPSGLRMPTSC